MPPEPPVSLSADASDVMAEYLERLVDSTRLANGTYADIDTADMVAVLQHHAHLHAEFGTEALHPRNRSETDDIPVLDGLVVQSESGPESTDRRWYNTDIGFVTGTMHGADITETEIAEVLRRLATFLEENGRQAVGSRTSRSE